MSYPLFIILYEHSFHGFLFLSIFPCFCLHVNLKQKTIKYSISIVKIRIADPGWIFPDPTFEKKNPDPDPNKFFTNAIYILLFLLAELNGCRLYGFILLEEPVKLPSCVICSSSSDATGDFFPEIAEEMEMDVDKEIIAVFKPDMDHHESAVAALAALKNDEPIWKPEGSWPEDMMAEHDVNVRQKKSNLATF